MAVTVFRIAGVSEELRGASRPNVIELGFASDEDALQFADNLSVVMAGSVTSVTKELVTNYALPYPAGTAKVVRCAAFDGVAHWSNFTIRDIKPVFDEDTRSAALISAGYMLWDKVGGLFYTPSVINITPFTPGQSV